MWYNQQDVVWYPRTAEGNAKTLNVSVSQSRHHHSIRGMYTLCVEEPNNGCLELRILLDKFGAGETEPCMYVRQIVVKSAI